MTTVDLNELEAAMMMVSGAYHEVDAWVGLDTGAIYLSGDGIDPELEPLPEDFDTSDRYVAVPGSRDLDLGQELVFDFVDAAMPDEYERVRQMFRRPGAYRHFGTLVDDRGLRERWHAFRNERTVAALRAWCEENGLQLGA